jgi:hypothetical protein
LIRVEGELRETLLAIKTQRMPLQEVLRRARELAREIDDEAKRSTLPEKPDFEVADAFLTDCRREAARRSLAVAIVPSMTREREGYRPTILPVPLPPDVRTDALERFVERYVSPDSSERIPLLSGPLSPRMRARMTDRQGSLVTGFETFLTCRGLQKKLVEKTGLFERL